MATATATRDIERIVRKVLKEEQDETLDAIQELSTLLTEQVIPKLSGDGAGESDPEQDEEQGEEDMEQDDVVPMSAYEARAAKSRRRSPVNGHDESEDPESEDPDQEEQEIPEMVTEAFADLYNALSPEQASALAELFTAVDSELNDKNDEEVRARA